MSIISYVRHLFQVQTSLDLMRQVLRRDALDDDQSYDTTVPAWRRPYRLTWSLMFWLITLVVFFIRLYLLSASLLLIDRDPDLYRTVLRLDPTIATIDRRLVHHNLFGLAWCPMGVVCFYLMYLIHLKPNRRIWAITVGPLMLTNGEHFFRLNTEYRLMDLGPVQRIKGFASMLHRLWHDQDGTTNKPRFHATRLLHYPNLSARVRARAVVVVWLWHHYEKGYFTIIVLLFTYIWARVTWLISFDYDPVLVLIGSVDTAVTLTNFYQVIQNAVFMTKCSILVAFTTGGQLNELQSRLATSLVSTQLNRPMQTREQARLWSVCLAMQLNWFREVNCRTLNDAYAVNAGAGSNTLLLCFGILLVFSVYFISVVFFRAVATPFTIVLFSVYMACCIMILSLNVLSMIHHVERLYAGAPLFGRLVPYFEAPGMIGPKLKTNHHYEVLHNQYRLYYTIGQLTTLCWDTLFRFTLLYSGYLMYSFKMFIKRKLA